MAEIQTSELKHYYKLNYSQVAALHFHEAVETNARLVLISLFQHITLYVIYKLSQRWI